jgi:hypothetical protein
MGHGVSGDSEAMDKQPGQQQRDGQQQPRPQPGRQKTHMLSVPSSSRMKGRAWPPGADVRDFLPH